MSNDVLRPAVYCPVIRIDIKMSVYNPVAGTPRHHSIPPRSLEDKARMKKMMIRSHVMTGVFCMEHLGGFQLDHHVCVCNCSRFSREALSFCVAVAPFLTMYLKYPYPAFSVQGQFELDQILLEAYNDYFYYIERHFRTYGFPMYDTPTVEQMLVRKINNFFPRNFGLRAHCHPGWQKLTNLRNSRMELFDHILLGCGESMEPSMGFFYETFPHPITVQYIVMPTVGVVPVVRLA